jgi:flagellar basal-body rod modification protein FlgD
MNVAISGVQNPNSVAQTNTAVTSGDKMTMGKEDFMKLLIAQLKNQDPNAPVDAKEFVTQLSQLTSVEQLTNMSSQLKSLTTATTGLVSNEAGNFVGKNIEANGSKLYLGDQNSPTSAFTLAQSADEVTITIRDEKGQAVRTIEKGFTKVGTTPMTWDGKDDAGERVDAGAYTMTIEAKTKAGAPVIASAEIKGIVTKVSYEQGFPELVVGDAHVALANVTSIKQ